MCQIHFDRVCQNSPKLFKREKVILTVIDLVFKSLFLIASLFSKKELWFVVELVFYVMSVYPCKQRLRRGMNIEVTLAVCWQMVCAHRMIQVYGRKYFHIT